MKGANMPPPSTELIVVEDFQAGEMGGIDSTQIVLSGCNTWRNKEMVGCDGDLGAAVVAWPGGYREVAEERFSLPTPIDYSRSVGFSGNFPQWVIPGSPWVSQSLSFSGYGLGETASCVGGSQGINIWQAREGMVETTIRGAGLDKRSLPLWNFDQLSGWERHLPTPRKMPG